MKYAKTCDIWLYFLVDLGLTSIITMHLCLMSNIYIKDEQKDDFFFIKNMSRFLVK
jgi:hypothetical protein